MTARCHVDDGKLAWNLLFCECDEDPTRKSRVRMIVQLEAHGCGSSKTCCLGHDGAAHNGPNEKGYPVQHGRYCGHPRDGQPRTLLSIEEEAIIVAFRRHTLLSLDDCL